MFSTALHHHEVPEAPSSWVHNALKRFAQKLASFEQEENERVISRLVGGVDGRLTDEVERQIALRLVSRGFRG